MNKLKAKDKVPATTLSNDNIIGLSAFSGNITEAQQKRSYSHNNVWDAETHGEFLRTSDEEDSNFSFITLKMPEKTMSETKPKRSPYKLPFGTKMIERFAFGVTPIPDIFSVLQLKSYRNCSSSKKISSSTRLIALRTSSKY